MFKVFINKGKRILGVQDDSKFHLYKIVGKNKRIKFPDYISDIIKYLRYLGEGDIINVGEETDKEWEEIKGGDRI